jgi:hypothetical protein
MLTFKDDTREHSDGRRYQALDGQAQDGAGAGHRARQDHRGRGQSGLRPGSLRDRGVGRGRQEGMENALRTKPLEVKEQYERQLKELQEAYGEAMLELRARKKLASLLGNEDEK